MTDQPKPQIRTLNENAALLAHYLTDVLEAFMNSDPDNFVPATCHRAIEMLLDASTHALREREDPADDLSVDRQLLTDNPKDPA